MLALKVAKSMRNGSLCFSQPHTLAARQTYYHRLTDVLFAYILSLVCSRGIAPFCNVGSEQITQRVLQLRSLKVKTMYDSHKLIVNTIEDVIEL